MPGIMVHYFCGDYAAKLFDNDIIDIISRHRQEYSLGTQGPDNFFYYPQFFAEKSAKGIGTRMHKESIGAFFRCMAERAKELPADDRAPAASYLCGFIMHYAMDTNAHPYVYYKTGFLRKGEYGGMKYSAAHRRFETALDVKMLEYLENKKPSDVKIFELLELEKQAGMAVSSFIGSCINSVYGTNISDRAVYESFIHMKRITRMLQSGKGRKKRFIEFIERATVRQRLISSMVHSEEYNDGIDYLNMRRAKWCYPWDASEELTLTFPEIFGRAVGDGVLMVNRLGAYLRGEISIDELMKVIGDRSFLSGLDSSDTQEFVCFETVFTD